MFASVWPWLGACFLYADTSNAEAVHLCVEPSRAHSRVSSYFILMLKVVKRQNIGGNTGKSNRDPVEIIAWLSWQLSDLKVRHKELHNLILYCWGKTRSKTVWCVLEPTPVQIMKGGCQLVKPWNLPGRRASANSFHGWPLWAEICFTAICGPSHVDRTRHICASLGDAVVMESNVAIIWLNIRSGLMTVGRCGRRRRTMSCAIAKAVNSAAMLSASVAPIHCGRSGDNCTCPA